MLSKKIAFFECDEERQEFFSRNLKNFELKFYPDHLSPKHVPEIADCEIVYVLNNSPVTRDIVSKLKETKLIVAGATGYNNIDVQACEDYEIMVSNTPGYSVDTVAEYTFTLMLMLIRNAHKAFVRAQNNDFSWDGLIGSTLSGKTLGVIGTGKVGLKVIQIARGFGMKVLAYDIYPNEDMATKYCFKYVPLAEVLQGSDIISLHITANSDTYHFINKDTIKLIKRGAYLVNTSRGEVLDSRALIWALDNGIIKCAALDVLEEELLCQENNLLKPGITPLQLEKYALNQHLIHRDDVLVTPHIGWFTNEAVHNMFSINLSNILSYYEGSPNNLVSRIK